MPTTRGDRLFIGLLGAPGSISAGWGSRRRRSGVRSVVAVVWFVLVMRFG